MLSPVCGDFNVLSWIALIVETVIHNARIAVVSVSGALFVETVMHTHYSGKRCGLA